MPPGVAIDVWGLGVSATEGGGTVAGAMSERAISREARVCGRMPRAEDLLARRGGAGVDRGTEDGRAQAIGPGIAEVDGNGLFHAICGCWFLCAVIPSGLVLRRAYPETSADYAATSLLYCFSIFCQLLLPQKLPLFSATFWICKNS
jgi:hypothetical protein